MAYFNHAFAKCFLGTKGTQSASAGVSAGLDEGFLLDGNIHSLNLANGGAPYALGPGSFGMFDKDTYNSIAEADLVAGECCPLVLVAASLKLNDKQGPFHGGYQESNKSKYINPKLVREFYRVDICQPQQNIVHVGATNFTTGNATCTKPFFCDETYYLRVEVKGSPALRFANHNVNRTMDASGGCCAGPIPTEVDSTLIFIQWATQIVEDSYLLSFVKPIVFDEAGIPWFHTAADAVAAGHPATQIWENYVSAGHNVGDMGGMRLIGAYVDTVFGNCTFQVTDHFEKEPIRILASLTDLNGDPCTFEGLCVIEECPALQGMGFGEQVVRDLIKSEAYLQNFFATDVRTREITQGDQILGSVTRGQMYTRYYILHTVPRFNNASGMYDNDQYLLDIITNAPSASFESFMDTWLTNCGDGCTTMKVRGCTPCAPVAIPAP